MLSGLGRGRASGDLLVGLDHGDDAAAVRIDPASDGTGRAVIATADFFTPVVDDAYAFGRIAESYGLRDDALTVYRGIRRPAMPGLTPVAWDFAQQRLKALGATP